ncbi:MAG: TldD/PmbA family protein [Bacillota bacterium]|jgi:TldD protein
MKDLLRNALKLADVDYCEIRFEESELLSISYQGKSLDTITRDTPYGGNVRALHKGGWGFACFNNLDELESAVKSAVKQAKLAGGRLGLESKLAPAPVIEDEYVPEYTLDPRGVSLSEKLRIIGSYLDFILGYDKAITAAQIIYNERISTVYFANSEGTYIKQEKLDIGSNLAATARRGMTTVVKRIGRGSSIGFDCMLDAYDELGEACSLAIQLLDAPQVKAGVYPVVCDPALAGLFVHEAFGHLSEADNAYKNPQLAKTMTLGRVLGRDILAIYDTGEYPKNRGYLKYDDEGVPTRRAYLVKDGVLVGRLHSRETAGIMGEELTGNARALNYTFPPLVRMRNTCIAPGDATLEDMIKDIKLGLYAVGSGGGQTNGEMFNFMAGHGFMIRDGKLAELVKDVKLMGNVFTTLMNIDMIGNDLAARDGAGGCGKGGQMPLPTSGLCPSIRIQNVIVGGAK